MAKVAEVQQFTATATPTWPMDDNSTHRGPFDEWLITVKGGNINWSDAPRSQNEVISSTTGTLLVENDYLPYRGDFSLWRCVLVSGTPVVRIHKYQRTVGW